MRPHTVLIAYDVGYDVFAELACRQAVLDRFRKHDTTLASTVSGINRGIASIVKSAQIYDNHLSRI
jgi:hypothetical protein